MYKQYISIILIIALFLQVCCYSGRIITAEEVRTNNDIDELTVMKSDSSKLYFEKSEFTVVNDTLKGQGRILGPYSHIRDIHDYNIPLSDIVEYETSEFDGVKTTIFIVGTILGVVVLFLLLFWAQGGVQIDLSGFW